MNELTNYAFNSFWSIGTIFEAFDEISLSELEFRRAISKKELDQHRQIILGEGEERSEVDQICLECELTYHLQQLIDLCNRHFKNQLRLEMTDDDNGRTDDQQQQTVTTPGGEQAQ